ncbi:MAG TPA: GNAT family N-acetyltransferase [Allosphingosinicella sp.]|nr:GNAT family N-acetyltransferase [Allosphingosinicella sp.]
MSEILTARLKLRRARIEDLDAIHAILGNAQATRFWSTPPHASVEESREWLQSMIDAPPEESDDYVVEYEGRVIGKAGCWRMPEIGFVLHPDYWGRGLAGEAVAAAVASAFAKFPVDELIADVDPRNAASLALLKRLGFVETGRSEGTWEWGEETCDSVYLALRRGDSC